MPLSDEEIADFFISHGQEVRERCDKRWNYEGIGAQAYRQEENKSYFYMKMAIEMIKDERVNNAIR